MPQRVDKSPLAAVGFVAQHHAAAVVRPGITVLEIGNIGEETRQHFAPVGAEEAMFAVARHGDQPVGVRLADQVIGTGDYHLAVLAQDAPFTVAQNTHPATFIGFADLGIKAGNDGFPRFVDTAPELAGLHPGHAVVERPGHRKLRSPAVSI